MDYCFLIMIGKLVMGWKLFVKWIFDFIVGLIGMILSLLIVLVFVIFVKLIFKGLVFYK